jgi:Bacterial type II and III secretion system protein
VKRFGLSASVLLLAVAVPLAAEEKAEGNKAQKTIMLNVQMVMTTRQGEKKIRSLPYSFPCMTDGDQGANIRIGVEVPIAITQFGDPKGREELKKSTSFQYRNVGTNIRCSADALDDGRFKLNLNVEQSSIYEDVKLPAAAATDLAPMFRTWTAIFKEALRDGQTVQAITSSDPFGGDTTTLDVTLKVVK